MPAGFLHLGEPVVTLSGVSATVEAIHVVPGAARMWDLTVATVHTFAVGDAQAVVHNCGDKIPWSSKSVKNAAEAIDSGEDSVTVRNRSEAEELYLNKFHGDGYRNATGLDGVGTKQMFGEKGGTYHWDEGVDPEGRVAGHGADNPHGELPHLQIHTTGDSMYGGRIIRIFFGGGW